LLICCSESAWFDIKKMTQHKGFLRINNTIEDEYIILTIELLDNRNWKWSWDWRCVLKASWKLFWSNVINDSLQEVDWIKLMLESFIKVIEVTWLMIHYKKLIDVELRLRLRSSSWIIEVMWLTTHCKKLIELN
jgi:hypothetical protein